MTNRVVPMIHVPDVKATVNWYERIGFTVCDTYGEDGEGLSFAILSFGESELMFNSGGQRSGARRREVDLYIYTESVDELFESLKDRVAVVEPPHDTFYGMREFIIRDNNGFWLTFGQPSAFEMLMAGVHGRNPELVRNAIESGNLSLEALTSALSVTSGDSRNEQIAELLRSAGATPPVIVSVQKLQSYAGTYQNEQGMSFDITLADETLIANPAGQRSSNLVAIDERTFRPAAFDGISITFITEDGRTTGLTYRQGSVETNLRKISSTDS